MPKQTKAQPARSTKKRMIIVVTIVVVLLLAALILVLTRDKWLPGDAKQQATCTQKEVGPQDPFYQQATIVRDGKRYIEICV